MKLLAYVIYKLKVFFFSWKYFFAVHQLPVVGQLSSWDLFLLYFSANSNVPLLQVFFFLLTFLKLYFFSISSRNLLRIVDGEIFIDVIFLTYSDNFIVNRILDSN